MKRMALNLVAAAFALAALLSWTGARAEPHVVTVAHGLVNPWGLAGLPDGRFLVTERPGRLRVVGTDGKLSAPVSGLPAVAAGGQGGLLDVVLDPAFSSNRLVYWSYAEPGDGDTNGTAVARGRIETEGPSPRMTAVQVIFRQQPKVASRLHFGSRLAFAPDGRLFVTLGERFSNKDDAQRLGNHLGKVVRIEADGRVPADNPLVGRPDAKPEIWSWGHRNVQGAAIHPVTGELWTHEHGPQGGDELNVDLPGRNYGWPVITYGRNYVTGTVIGEGTERADVEPPVTYWVPTSVAPSGMAFVTSERYPGWKGQLLIGTLRAQVLLRLELDGHRVKQETRMLKAIDDRIRDVRQAPDGWIYLLTDNADGRLLRLLP
jgi:glucose/arabinose dehydrogenase